MKLTLQTQLLPDDDQAERLRETVERFNKAANWLAGLAFSRKVSNKFVLQKIAYSEIRSIFGLPADMAIRCISRVVEAYKPNREKRPKFRKHASVPFSMGKNISFKGPDRVSISTLVGRLLVPFVMGKYQADRFGWSKGQSDLVLRSDGKWFLLVTVDVPDGTVTPATDFIGVDLGVENIAVDSDGEIHSSAAIEAKRSGYAKRRSSLSRMAAKADRKRRRRCHKALRRMEGRESRYRRDVNHQITKQIVSKAKDTDRGIAIEDLNGIRERMETPKKQRARVGSWSFFQFRAFLEYKARMEGVPVVAIHPRYTSRTCSKCGHCDKENRKSRSRFKCRSCGYRSHADINAAQNIGLWAGASVIAPIGSEPQSDNPAV